MHSKSFQSPSTLPPARSRSSEPRGTKPELDIPQPYAPSRVGFRARIRTTMTNSRRLTAIIEREGDGYVSLCPELDVASQGDSIEEARANLIEALTLFFESADSSEIGRRLHSEILVTQVEVPVG